jgi:hypothetical protein
MDCEIGNANCLIVGGWAGMTSNDEVFKVRELGTGAGAGFLRLPDDIIAQMF